MRVIIIGGSGHVGTYLVPPWEEWRTTVSEQEAAASWDHIAHSPNCSIAKAQRLLNYKLIELFARVDSVSGQ